MYRQQFFYRLRLNQNTFLHKHVEAKRFFPYMPLILDTHELLILPL